MTGTGGLACDEIVEAHGGLAHKWSLCLVLHGVAANRRRMNC